MKSILDLQRALLSEDSSAVRDILDENNRKTSNQSMRAASAALGFKVASLDGWLVTTGAEVARVMGYTNDSAVREMRRKYGLMTFSGGWSSSEMTTLREVFGLKQKDTRTAFCGWDTLLVCGARGRTQEADKILAYLIDCERALRVITDRDLLEQEKLNKKDCMDLLKLLKEYRIGPDDELTRLLGERIESAYGIKLPPRSQLRLI